MEDKLSAIIRNALDEDIQSGDITTLAVIPPGLTGRGIFLLKEDGIAAGLSVAREVFRMVDSGLLFSVKIEDGAYAEKGTILAEVKGRISSILTAERTALNFMQRMSGIATAANRLSSRIRHTGAKIIDTRKTAPGLRLTDKMAVRSGGCGNHRGGLYDMFLIKDNHIAAAGSISKAVEACREYNRKNGTAFRIEVETTNIPEVKEALDAGPDIIMLDNFETEEMKKAVKLVDGKCLLEASGNVNENTVVPIAETGVDFISVGAVTHSVKSLDISLEIVKE